ncbi:hypothetical protein J3R83DRAFT_7888 [Lanmaoa asiatica]|nr:hypothetical protein J3R83DRAFT_7888 [Lanmaoa asiatica]
MRITSSLVAFALYLSFAAASVIPSIPDVPGSSDDISRILAGGKRQVNPLEPINGSGGGGGIGGILGGLVPA